MTTIGQLVDRTLNQWLMGTYRARWNALVGDIDAAATDFGFVYELDQIGEGSYVALGQELALVTGANTASKTLTVVRGTRGTVAAPHPAGTPVEVNPRYPRFLVREAMRDDVLAWPDNLYWVDRHDVVVPAYSTVLGFTDYGEWAEVTGIVAARRTSRWHPGKWVPITDYDADLTTGELYLEDGWSSDFAYRLLLARRFVLGTFDDVDDLETMHIPEHYGDLMCLGAAWRLVTGKETRRLDTDASGQSRVAQEVRERELARFGAQLMQLRNQRLADEATRLIHRYGIHSN